ncbi:M14 family metallopeptidase [Kordiimonas aquimaris]|uniref:M14 family metallopeptidase n=1 Tax=Kordiimonas aquimaris TaxID=707591 RepID=UPI0021CFBFDE|nr:M14-type cytosolic carboxypeptidase [Kordiimonas aquimaris]
MLVSSKFDSGNIKVIDSKNPGNIRLKINRDAHSDFFQWFHFRISGVADTPCTIIIENAGDAAYTGGWQDYSVCASYDRESWHRIETSYTDGELKWSVTPKQDSLYFAYFAPYSMERHADLIADVATSPLVRTSVLGHTLDGQDMDLVEIGHGPEGRKKVWLIARQHPGETMAEWWMEGVFDYLLDEDNPVARQLLDAVHFYIVPNMNPDGSKRGHLRTNAAGANLNREWNNPSADRSPEVLMVREKMHQTGIDFHLDVHGDEALPYNFVAGFEGIPSITQSQLDLLAAYKETLCALTPDFQTKYGYPVDAPKTSDLKKCTDYVAETFNCVSMTLEMPFKDNANLPDDLFGWSPDRCRYLAHSCLAALAQHLNDL